MQSELRMGGSLRWLDVREKAAGKWQIPALFLAIGAMGLSLATYRSPSSKFPFDLYRDELPPLIESEMYSAAIETAGILLSIPDKSIKELAPVHAAVALARMLQAERGNATPPSVGQQAVEYYGLAVDGGYRLTGEDARCLGTAYEWMGNYPQAVAYYDDALNRSENVDPDLLRHVAELRADRVGAPPDVLEKEVDRLTSASSARPDILRWAVERKIDYVCDRGQCELAPSIVDEQALRFSDEPWGDWLDYLRSYAAFRVGNGDVAEVLLRDLRERLTMRGELYDKSGWLLGMVVLGDDRRQRPLEAATFFRDVVSSTSTPVHAAAAELGLAESLVALERFDQALDRYRGVVRKLKRLPPNPVLDAPVVATSLTVSSEALRRAGQFRAALDFATEAVNLVSPEDAPRRTLLLDRLAGTQVALARRLRARANELNAADGSPERIRDLRAEARSLLLSSASAYSEIEDLRTMDETDAGQAAWLAAERTNESGDLAATIDAMERFIFRHSESPLIARALRYLGQAQQAAGQFADAVESYQQNLRRFPRTPDAGSSLIPLARCYMAMGDEYADQAKKTLKIILDDSDVFTPIAPEYADALFLMAEVLKQTGAWEEAVPVFEEAIERYASDPRVTRARFLLGDCYRQSGLALTEDFEKADFAGERQRLLVERERRLRRAARMFERVVTDDESRDPSTLSRLDAVYLRHARLYIGDCYFELGEYDKALARYERSAWMYRGTSAALSAYVQIINCHVFQGDREEASAALRRALYLVETTTDFAFAEGAGLGTRDDWRSYFEWVGQSELF